MSLLKRIAQIDRKFAWSFLGVLIGIGFGLLSVYTGFFQEHKPNLRFEILSNTSVLDIHEPIGKLDIFYSGNNIKESKQTLRIITVRIINDGQVDILKSYYDENDPVGFSLVGSTVVEKPELLQTSNEYLSKNVKLDLRPSQRVLFSNVIIETGEFFALKILVLHNEGDVPDIVPVGKVAGVKSITVTRPYQHKDEVSFWSRTFGGGVLTQLVRLFSYLFAFVLLVIAFVLMIVLPITSIFDRVGKQKRKKLIDEFKAVSQIQFEQDDDLIFQSFVENGQTDLLLIERLLSKPEALEKMIISLNKNGGKDLDESIDFYSNSPEFEHYRYIRRRPVILTKRMLEAGFILKVDSGIIINERMKKTFDAFLRYLRIRNKIESIDTKEETPHGPSGNQ